MEELAEAARFTKLAKEGQVTIVEIVCRTLSHDKESLFRWLAGSDWRPPLLCDKLRSSWGPLFHELETNGSLHSIVEVSSSVLFEREQEQEKE
jgi:hypothetical protein